MPKKCLLRLSVWVLLAFATLVWVAGSAHAASFVYLTDRRSRLEFNGTTDQTRTPSEDFGRFLYFQDHFEPGSLRASSRASGGASNNDTGAFQREQSTIVFSVDQVTTAEIFMRAFSDAGRSSLSFESRRARFGPWASEAPTLCFDFSPNCLLPGEEGAFQAVETEQSFQLELLPSREYRIHYIASAQSGAFFQSAGTLFQARIVPEPGTALLLGLGCAFLSGSRRSNSIS